MNHFERLPQYIGERVRDNIRGILNTDNAFVLSRIGIAAESVLHGEVDTIYIPPTGEIFGSRISSPHLSLAEGRFILPHIAINPNQAASCTPDKMQADLVLTLDIIQQLQQEVYHKTFREIGYHALVTQTSWAGEGSPLAFGADFHGEIPDMETRLLILLGEARYFSDLDFNDWTNAGRRLLAEADNSRFERWLQGHAFGVGSFVAIREFLIEDCHDEVKGEYPLSYLELPAQHRAVLIAESLLDRMVEYNYYPEE